MQQISTNKLKSRKTVEIDGHPYTVRRYGAGEQLTLNQLIREGTKLDKKREDGSLTDEDELKAEQLAMQLIDIFAGLFDDGEDGTKSKALVSSLNQAEVQEMFKQIFPEDYDASPEVS